EGGDGTDASRAGGCDRGGLGRGARAVGEGDEVVRGCSAGGCDGGGGGRTCPTRGCEAERRKDENGGQREAEEGQLPPAPARGEEGNGPSRVLLEPQNQVSTLPK